MKEFFEKDVIRDDGFPRLYANFPVDLIRNPLDWQIRGLTHTLTGYGKKLTSEYMIFFEGKKRRIYHTIFSNIGSSWFNYGSERIYLS